MRQAPMTIGEMAQRLGTQPWKIRRAIARGYLREPHRFGVCRAFAEADVPAVRKALKAAGYLPAESETVPA